MNDEKIAVINMVSEGIVTPAEGIALFEALCDLGNMGSYQGYAESENLPPWEYVRTEANRASEFFSQNECALGIASANQGIVYAMQHNELESVNIPAAVSALDVAELSGFSPCREVSAGTQYATVAWNIRTASFSGAEALLIWHGAHRNQALNALLIGSSRCLSRICIAPGTFRLEPGADEVVVEWDKIKMVSNIESSRDSVVTRAGKFSDCLEMRIVITGIGGMQFGGNEHLLKMIGEKLIWFAPNVGIVKLLYDHPNNTQTEIDLVDHHVQDGEPLYFPLSPGNRWQYEWQDALSVHKELIRVFPDEGAGKFTLSCANHIAG